jgi:hypothetical protein
VIVSADLLVSQVAAAAALLLAVVDAVGVAQALVV